MATFLQTLPSFLAVIALSAATAKISKMPSGFAPLPVMCAVMVMCVLGGYLSLLTQTVILIYALAILAIVYLIITAEKQPNKQLLTPAFLVFCVFGFAFLVFLAVRTPIPQGWDEFSMWATSAKMTKSGNAIYSSVESGFPWPNTQKPGLPTLSYFFNFFGEFEAWRMYFAYDLLLISVWSAAIASFKFKHWKIVLPTCTLMFLLQYFHVYTRNIYCDFSYLTSYADYPMGILAGGAVMWYFHAARMYKPSGINKNTTASFCAKIALPLSAIIAAVCLCKDTGLALACIAAMVIGADLLFVWAKQNGTKLLSHFTIKELAPKLLVIIAMFASAGIIFVSSSVYLSSLGNSQGSVGGASEMGYGTMLIEGTKQLLGLQAGQLGEPFVETFATVKGEMIAYFLPAASGEPSTSITMIGCGLFVLLFVWLLCASTFALCKDSAIRKSAVSYAIFSTIGFFAYYVFIGFTYVYVFKSGITDYNRYINTYYMMWVGGAIVLFAIGAVQKSRFKNALTLFTIILSVAFLARFNQLVQPQLSIIDYPDAVYTEVESVKARADAVKEKVEDGAKLFYVNNGDNGLQWFQNHYELLPENILMYSNGGGMFADPRYFESVDAQQYIDNYNPVITLEEFAAYLAIYECDYVFLDNAYTEFHEGYRALLSDGGQANYQGETILYKVNIKGTPIYEDLTADDVYYSWETDSEGNVAPNKNYDKRIKMVNARDCVTLTPVEMEVPAS